jgi:hypothetical protein
VLIGDNVVMIDILFCSYYMDNLHAQKNDSSDFIYSRLLLPPFFIVTVDFLGYISRFVLLLYILL